MPPKKAAQDTSAEDQVAADLAAAQENGQGLSATVTQGVPAITVEVMPDNVISHGGQTYEAGESVELDGPSAIALIQLGHVKAA